MDIGGTKLDAQLYPVIGGFIEEEAVWSRNPATARGLANLLEQIADIVAQAVKAAQGLQGRLAGVGIGSPGRFDASGVIKPGTATNLERTPGEFDNINLRQALLNALQNHIREADSVHVSVENDANAMLTRMIRGIRKGHYTNLRDQHENPVSLHSLLGRHVALLGIGTGVGHAIAANVDEEGRFRFVTDGHASKLRVPVEESDWPLVLKAHALLGDRMVIFPDLTARAEDLFRGPVITAIAGVEDGRSMIGNLNDHLHAIRFAGKYMARTIALIRLGEHADIVPAHGWSAEEKAEAAKTSVYLVCGGMGSSPLGTRIIRYASEELEQLGLDYPIQLVQMPGPHIIARAAAAMVPVSAYKEKKEPA
jgi:hypothetical protein